MDRSFWAKAGTICLLPCSMFHAKCSHSTPHNRVSLLHASVFLLLIVFSLSVLVPFLEAGNYCPHRTIHTLCMSYTWELILYHLVYFPRFYSQGYFSLFVSKSSIVKRTKKWLCFVICPSQDLTSLPLLYSACITLKCDSALTICSSRWAHVTFQNWPFWELFLLKYNTFWYKSWKITLMN